MSIRVIYRDEQGFKRAALIPYEGVDPVEGIPVSLPVERLYGHMPREFSIKLIDLLFERGLIEPKDFFKAGAAEIVQSIIRDTAKYDALDILKLAKEIENA